MKLDNNFKLEKYGLLIRLVNEDDAPFIVQLRTDPKLAKYLNPISSDIEQQKEWIREYKKREEAGTDYYFIYYWQNQAVGLCRLYNIEEKSFTGGSWVFSGKIPFEVPILASFITRTIAFEDLNKEVDSFEVRKENKQVVRFHKLLGAEITHSDEANHYFSLTKEVFEKNKDKFENLLR